TRQNACGHHHVRQLAVLMVFEGGIAGTHHYGGYVYQCWRLYPDPPVSPEVVMTTPARPAMALAYPFRIFFLLAGVYPLLLIAGWIAFLFAAVPLPVGWAPMQWHSHEMIYGFVTAAIAGFVLTAMTHWTGAPPLRGRNLLLLALLWVAGRVVMWLAGWLPGWLVAIVDLAFLPVLAGYIATV